MSKRKKESSLQKITETDWLLSFKLPLATAIFELENRKAPEDEMIKMFVQVRFWQLVFELHLLMYYRSTLLSLTEFERDSVDESLLRKKSSFEVREFTLS